VIGRTRGLIDAADPDPIENAFFVVTHRTIQLIACLLNKITVAMVFKWIEAAQRSWCRLDGPDDLLMLVLDANFAEKLEVVSTGATFSLEPPPDLSGRHQDPAIACMATWICYSLAA
jgi:hypothetical protein